MKDLALRSAMKNIMQLRRTQRMSSMQELCKLRTHRRQGLAEKGDNFISCFFLKRILEPKVLKIYFNSTYFEYL